LKSILKAVWVILDTGAEGFELKRPYISLFGYGSFRPSFIFVQIIIHGLEIIAETAGMFFINNPCLLYD